MSVVVVMILVNFFLTLLPNTIIIEKCLYPLARFFLIILIYFFSSSLNCIHSLYWLDPLHLNCATTILITFFSFLPELQSPSHFRLTSSYHVFSRYFSFYYFLLCTLSCLYSFSPSFLNVVTTWITLHLFYYLLSLRLDTFNKLYFSLYNICKDTL